MSRYKLLFLLGVATLAVAGAFGACSSSGGGNVALNSRTGPTATADDGGMGDAGTGDGGTAAGVDLGNGIVVDRIRIVIRKLEMDVVATGGDGGLVLGDAGTGDGGLSMGDAGHDDDLDGDDRRRADDGDHKGGDDDVVRGPFLIDLSGAPLASGIHEAFDTDVPAGTYQEVCFDVNTVSKHMTGGDGQRGRRQREPGHRGDARAARLDRRRRHNRRPVVRVHDALPGGAVPPGHRDRW